MIEEFLIGQAFEKVISFLKSYNKKQKKKLVIDKQDFETAISLHQNEIAKWSSEISFSDLQKSKATRDTFINLSFHLTPRSNQIIDDEQKLPLEEIIEEINSNLVILGKPGAGKTSSMKFICNKLLTDESFLENSFQFPIVIRLRELKIIRKAKGYDSDKKDIVESLYYRLYNILGLKIEINSSKQTYLIDDSSYRSQISLIKNIVLQTLDELNVLLILDGWDEIATFHKESLIEEIRFLVGNLNSSKLIVTSRTNEFNYDLANSEVYEICDLDDNQIKNFIRKWLNKNDASDNLYEQIKHSPFKDTLAKPLTLAHLCAIYERYGKIPEKPKTLYHKIVMLLLEEWDAQRSVIRKSKYSNFEADRKFDFLCNMSYYLTTELQKVTFSRKEFENAYKQICENFNLPPSENKQVAKELESHTGLFIQTGYEKYEFAHKSLQEYLAAEYIVKLPQIPFNTFVLARLPNELALAISISSNPTNYFSGLVLVNLHIGNGINNDFINKFLNRLYIEKPDFIVHPILAIAFLSLYEKCYMNNQLDEIFSLFFKNNQVKSSLEKLKSFYKTENNQSRENKIHLSKIAFVNNEVTSKLPEKLIAKREFYE